MTQPKIPFIFLSPIPKFFKDKGLLKNPKNAAFLLWCFERCTYEAREIIHDNQKIILQPYQFIFGRRICSEETGLTDNEVRHQQELWEKLDFLKKGTNKTPNRFTIYEWSTEHFSIINHQQNPQYTTNKQPTEPPQTRTTEPIDIKEQTEQIQVSVVGLFSCLGEFGLSDGDKQWISQFSEAQISRAIAVVNETKNPRSPIGLLKNALAKGYIPKKNPQFELSALGKKNKEDVLIFKSKFEDEIKLKDIEIKNLGDCVKFGIFQISYEDMEFGKKVGEVLNHFNLLHLVKPSIREEKIVHLKSAEDIGKEILKKLESK